MCGLIPAVCRTRNIIIHLTLCEKIEELDLARYKKTYNFRLIIFRGYGSNQGMVLYSLGYFYSARSRGAF